jgi:signal transduction histidine kinase
MMTRTNLRRLKWIAILVPAAAVGIFEQLRHTIFVGFLHGPGGNLLTVAIAVAAIFIFAHVVFGLLGRMQSSLLERNEELSTLNRVIAAVGRSLEVDQILEVGLDGILRALGREQGMAWFWEEENKKLVLKAQRGIPASLAQKVAQLKEGQPILRALARTDGNLTIVDAGLDMAFPPRLIVVPLRAKGKLLGAIAVDRGESTNPAPLKGELLSSMASHVAMAIDNAKLFQETARRQQEAQALYNVALEVSTLMDIGQILDSVVAKAQELLGVDLVALALQEDDHEMVTRAARGFRSDPVKVTRQKPWSLLSQKAAFWGQVVTEHCTDPAQAAEDLDSIARVEGTISHIAAPLKVGQQVVGVLHGANRRFHSFSQHEIELFSSLANQAAIAVENARLYSQVQNLAVLEERDRLAREMHDGLAQVLGYLSLKAASAQELLAAQQSEGLRAELRQMEKAAQEAYVDVREAILGLRSSVVLGGGLVRTLTEYLHKFTSQSGIKAELTTSPDGNPQLPPATEVQLIRIIQEALTNVRKHARAKRVWVRLEIKVPRAKIEVEDDGQGFDLPEVLRQEGHHFGLHTMKERAESVGGQLHIDTKPGQGTKVRINLPIGGKEGVYEPSADSLGRRPHPL